MLADAGGGGHAVAAHGRGTGAGRDHFGRWWFGGWMDEWVVGGLWEVCISLILSRSDFIDKRAKDLVGVKRSFCKEERRCYSLSLLQGDVGG